MSHAILEIRNKSKRLELRRLRFLSKPPFLNRSRGRDGGGNIVYGRVEEVSLEWISTDVDRSLEGIQGMQEVIAQLSTWRCKNLVHRLWISWTQHLVSLLIKGPGGLETVARLPFLNCLRGWWVNWPAKLAPQSDSVSGTICGMLDVEQGWSRCCSLLDLPWSLANSSFSRCRARKSPKAKLCRKDFQVLISCPSINKSVLPCLLHHGEKLT